MKKRVLAVLLTVLMCVQLSVCAFAGNSSSSAEIQSDVTVGLDIGIKKDGDSSAYKRLEQAEGMTNDDKFDFKAVLSTSEIWEQIDAWYNKGIELIDGIYPNACQEKTDMLDAYNASVITGSFDVVITYPSIFNMATSYTNGTLKQMYGFNAEAKQIFAEEGRTLTVDGDTTTLVITVAIKNDDSFKLTAGDLHANYKSYLEKLEFTVENVNVVEDAEIKTEMYTFTGVMSGKVNMSFSGSDNVIAFSTEEHDAYIYPSTVAETETHVAYVTGYPDETVRPYGNVTREEIAMMFYRLLREDVKATIETDDNPYPDCDASSWSNTAIATMSKGGYMIGDDNGNFRPHDNITRAEFATIVVRFAALEGTDAGDVTFTDVGNHWAKDYIAKAAAAGWIVGDGDGTFAPDRVITRAEAMTILNRVLGRDNTGKNIQEGAAKWSDMDGSEWFYYAVIEATSDYAD